MQPFDSLVQNHASAQEFAAWFRSVPDSGPLAAAEWRDLFFPVARSAGGFDWLAPRDKGWIEACLLKFTRKAYTSFWKRTEHAWGTPPELNDFVAWLKSLPDNTLVDFCWDLLKVDYSRIPDPVYWLHHADRLTGAISLDNLRLAVGLVDEKERMFWWEEERWSVALWRRDSVPYRQLTSHSSYLVRAGAAAAMGGMYRGALQSGAPPIREILAAIQVMEVQTPGIAGPFLHGAKLCVPGDWDDFAEDFDEKAWFLETLRRSAREPDVPDLIPLEFFAHELFSTDADAIREFLRMGRRRLAVMTATEASDSVSLLLPVLHEMAACEDPEISAAIAEYLAAPSPHAGLHHLSD